MPLVGATIGALLVGIVTLFSDFPTATIVWVIYAVVYQQLENNFIQPQIQKRAVNVHPFIVLVAVLFGSTLLGRARRAGGDPRGGPSRSRSASGGTTATTAPRERPDRAEAAADRAGPTLKVG